MKIIVIGAGVAGLATAIALTKWSDEPHEIIIIELRAKPSTIGGAINLTPNALRGLHALGVLQIIENRRLGAVVERVELLNAQTGSKVGQIDFTGQNGEGIGTPPLKARRLLRSDLMQSLLTAVESLPNVRIEYGCKITSVAEKDDAVHILLESGQDLPALKADILIGCDGTHSTVRSLLVDPSRRPEYTGIAAVFAFTEKTVTDLPWKDTGLCQSQRGSIMCSVFEDTKTKQYVAAIMETEDVKSREGWLAMGNEKEKIKSNVQSRFSNCAIEGLSSLLDMTHSWTMYPVYKLGPAGRWSTKRALLLGDAAHAMPPQGESTGLAIEDAIVFARLFSRYHTESISRCFHEYETIRRPRIDNAYEEATFGWETQKDSNWFVFQFRMWITWIFLWFTSGSRLRRYSENLAEVELDQTRN